MSSLGICLKTSHCTGFPSLTEEELKLCQTSVFFFKKYMLHFQSLKFHWIFQKISNWVIKTFLTLRNEITYIKGSNLYANGYVGNHFLKLHLIFFFRPPSRMAVSRSYPRHLVQFCEKRKKKKKEKHFTSSFAILFLSPPLLH